MKTNAKTLWRSIRQYKFGSLLVRNFGFIFVLVIVPMLIVTSYGHRQLSKTTNAHVSSMNRELLEKSVAVTDNVIQDILGQLMQTMTLPEVADALADASAEADAAQAILTALGPNPYITRISLYSAVTQRLLDVESATALPIQQMADKESWYYLFQQGYIRTSHILVNGEKNLFFCGYIAGEADKPLGLLVFDVKMQRIQELLEREGLLQNSRFFISGLDGSILYCSRWDELPSAEREIDWVQRMLKGIPPGETQYFHHGDIVFISVAPSAFDSWNYALVTDLRGFDSAAEKPEDFLVNAVLVSLTTGLITAYVITLLTYQPIRKITDVIDKADAPAVTPQETNELLYITNNILNTLSSRDQAMNELEERLQALKRAQSLALQFQINPHFLYNTLETIKWCSVEEIGIGNRTSKLLTKVAKLYRFGLETDNVILTLEEELRFLTLYLDICNARYGDSIRFDLEIDEALYPCRIVKMSLQPLVENAIQHGIKPNGYHGTITIRAYRAEDCLCIAVINDGQGMDSEGIRQINENLQARRIWDSKKIGLLNVNERVKLLYGDKYGVTLSRNDTDGAQGMCVTITFPYDMVSRRLSNSAE